MKIAYIISAYKYPQQLVRLVKRLDADWASFYIHVDKNTDETIFDEMRVGLRHRPNVHFLARHRCYYSSFGHVQASLKGVRAALAQSPKVDYAILLTGQDYPIKSKEYIYSFVERNAQKSFLNVRPQPEEDWGEYHYRHERWHFITRRRHIALPPIGLLKRAVPNGIKVYGGSSYWNLSHEALRYIGEASDGKLARFYKHVFIPDEYFFQTLLMNSPLNETVVNDSLRFIDWSRPVGQGPAILNGDHLPALQQSPALFARKFDPSESQQILDAVDAMIETSEMIRAVGPL